MSAAFCSTQGMCQMQSSHFAQRMELQNRFENIKSYYVHNYWWIVRHHGRKEHCPLRMRGCPAPGPTRGLLAMTQSQVACLPIALLRVQISVPG